jgi:hypothetical protein
VRYEAAHLNRKNEVVGGRFPPGGESLLRRQLIKTIIELYGIKLAGIAFQPFRLGQSFHVKKPAPVLIMPTAATNEILHRHAASPRVLHHPIILSSNQVPSLRSEIGK